MAHLSDLVVIGGGAGGVEAALRAGSLGLSVAYIEPEKPSVLFLKRQMRALFRALEVSDLCLKASSFGLSVKASACDYRKINAEARALLERENKARKQTLEQNKVEVFKGTPVLLGEGRLSLSQQGKVFEEIEARHILLTRPKTPRVIAGLEPDGRLVWTLRDVLSMSSLPRTMLIIGAGDEGYALALLLNRLGVDITLVERKKRILPDSDESVSSFVREILEKRGVKVLEGSLVSKVDKNGKSVTVTIEKGIRSTLNSFERVLVAAGSDISFEGLGLEQTRAKIQNERLAVSPWFVSDEQGLYAVGDLIDPLCTPAFAVREAVLCVERIAGIKGLIPPHAPSLSFCTEALILLARVGLTEERARQEGHRIKTGLVVLPEKAGMVKTVFDEATGGLLGAHLVGADAHALASALTFARLLETTERELLQAVLPALPLAEALQESVKQAFFAR